MEVAVAGVEDVAHADAMLGGDLLDRRQDLGELGAWHDRVLHHEMRRHSPHCAERLLAPLPELGALGLVPGDANRARAVLLAQRFHRRDVVLDAGLRAIELDQQRRGGVGRIARGIDRGLHCAYRPLIDHLQRGRYDPRGHDVGHRVRRGVEAHEVSEQCADDLRVWREADGDLEGNAEAALGSHERADEIVAVALAVGAPELDDLAVGQEHRERDDVIRRDAVLEAVGSTGVLRDVATDRARGLARGVRCVVEPVRRHGAAERGVHHPRLYDGHSIRRVDRQHACQPMKADEGNAIGEGASGQARARAARHEWYARARELAHHGDRFATRPWKHREPRSLMVRRKRVRRVGQQLRRTEKDAPFADDGGESPGECLVDVRVHPTKLRPRVRRRATDPAHADKGAARAR